VDFQGGVGVMVGRKAMFAGSNRLTIDDKGRLAIPARLRAQLADEYGKELAVTLGPECIEIYPAPVFRTMAQQIPKIADRAKRVLVQRLFLGNAVESEIDGQGRIGVPPLLRDMKALGTDVVLVGAYDHFELWSYAQWQANNTEGQTHYADAFAALAVP
jgi:MraZ protein